METTYDIQEEAFDHSRLCHRLPVSESSSSPPLRYHAISGNSTPPMLTRALVLAWRLSCVLTTHGNLLSRQTRAICWCQSVCGAWPSSRLASLSAVSPLCLNFSNTLAPELTEFSRWSLVLKTGPAMARAPEQQYQGLALSSRLQTLLTDMTRERASLMKIEAQTPISMAKTTCWMSCRQFRQEWHQLSASLRDETTWNMVYQAQKPWGRRSMWSGKQYSRISRPLLTVSGVEISLAYTAGFETLETRHNLT